MTRNNVKCFRFCGQGASADTAAAEGFLATVPDLTAGYSPDEIYNMDETALFYRMESDRGLATKRLEGRKKDKERLTVVACTNANGTDKVPL